jgi:hypothetical protein
MNVLCTEETATENLALGLLQLPLPLEGRINPPVNNQHYLARTTSEVIAGGKELHGTTGGIIDPHDVHWNYPQAIQIDEAGFIVGRALRHVWRRHPA